MDIRPDVVLFLVKPKKNFPWFPYFSAWISILLQLKQHPWMQGLTETSRWSWTYTKHTHCTDTTNIVHTHCTHTHWTHTHCTNTAQALHNAHTLHTHSTNTAKTLHGAQTLLAWIASPVGLQFPLSRGQTFLASSCLWRLSTWLLAIMQHQRKQKAWRSIGWLWLFILIWKHIESQGQRISCNHQQWLFLFLTECNMLIADCSSGPNCKAR